MRGWLGEKQDDIDEWYSVWEELIKDWHRVEEIEADPESGDPAEIRSIINHVNQLSITQNKVRSPLK